MSDHTKFDLRDFLPYLLNQAAEMSSLGFQQYYKSQYGMLRTEWRVLFHLGRYGEMTAKDICDRARLHKTKVSRAVSALEARRFLTREQLSHDRRHEQLKLTTSGLRAFDELYLAAQKYDAEIMADFSDQEGEALRKALLKIAEL